MVKKLGVTRTKSKTNGGRPEGKEIEENRKKCEKAFNDGWGVLYASDQLGLNKNTVSSYYKIFREDMVKDMDTNFINEQKVARQMAIKKLDDGIEAIKVILSSASNHMGAKTPAFHNTTIKCIEVKMDLEQLRYSLEMSPTLDVPIEWIIADARKKIDHERARIKDLTDTK